jgi:hypothetical protein
VLFPEYTVLEDELILSSRDGPNRGLDYILIPIARDIVDDIASHPNIFNRDRVAVLQDDGRRGIPISGIASIRGEEKQVIVATCSGGVTNGVLMPGAIYSRTGPPSSFQKLYAVKLSGTIELGDSGSAVIDEKTGELYGHIVRGVPGTATAYVVAATEVFDDIRQRIGISDGVHLIPAREPSNNPPATTVSAEVARLIARNKLLFQTNAQSTDLSANPVTPAAAMDFGLDSASRIISGDNTTSTARQPHQTTDHHAMGDWDEAGSQRARSRTPEPGSATQDAPQNRPL